MSLSVKMIYQSQYQTLINRRENLIFQIEEINNQISKMRKDARKEGIDLDVQINKP